VEQRRSVNRVAVFGNAGGGKSTLARQLAEITGLPLVSIDVIKYRDGIYCPNSAIGDDEYRRLHADLIGRDRWIIDGFDTMSQTWERFQAADTLVFLDLPLTTHLRWITKRLLRGLRRTPDGWPSNTPVWASTMSGYRVLWLCHRRLTPKYRQHVAAAAGAKRVHHLRSPTEIRAFLHVVRLEQSD
jgi:adenylate kinase family enzyme